VNISVVDYGAGNVGSVIRMIERVGGSARRASTAAEIAQADKLILPGVGAFDYGMSQLAEHGLVDALHEAALQRKVPVLGICLGMQLMCGASEEGSRPGLGWIDGEAVRFRPQPGTTLRVPHMGWNTLQIVRESSILPTGAGEQRFYFVHSYHIRCSDPAVPVALASYGVDFVAAFQQANLWGVQFHPEKSHRFGMDLMRNFVELGRA
jgi:imidazole glycerol-phosphate synthase subunit HisH